MKTIEDVIKYLEIAIGTFDNDPPYTAFQRGYLAALKELQKGITEATMDHSLFYLDKLGVHSKRMSKEEAMRQAKRMIYSKAGRLGEILCVGVETLTGDVVWKWVYGKGVTFPDAAELIKEK